MPTAADDTAAAAPAAAGPEAQLEIEYCTRCRWLLRAGWLSQELLTTFEDELASVTLIPGTGGVFDIRLDGETLWSRRADGGFPDLADLKRRLRDRIAPDRSLGHTDKGG